MILCVAAASRVSTQAQMVLADFIHGRFTSRTNATVKTTGGGAETGLTTIIFENVARWEVGEKVYVTAESASSFLYVLPINFSAIGFEPENNRFVADAQIGVEGVLSTASHVAVTPREPMEVRGGTFTLKTLPMPGPIRISNIEIAVDTVNERYGGQGAFGWSKFLAAPSGSYCPGNELVAEANPRQIGAGLFFEKGVVQEVTVLGDALRLQLGTTTAYVDYLSASIINPTRDDWSFEAEMKINAGCPFLLYLKEVPTPVFPANLSVKGVVKSTGAFTLSGSGSLFYTIPVGSLTLSYAPKYTMDLEAELTVLGILNGSAAIGFDSAGLSGEVVGSVVVPKYVPSVGGQSFKASASFNDVGFSGSFSTKITPAIPRICTEEMFIEPICAPIWQPTWDDPWASVMVCTDRVRIPPVCTPAVPATYADVSFTFQGTDIAFDVSTRDVAAFSWENPLRKGIQDTDGVVTFFSNFQPMGKTTFNAPASSREIRALASSSTSVTIPENAASVMIVLNHETAVTNFVNLIARMPDGALLSAIEGQLPHGFSNNMGYARSTERATTIYLHRPAAGIAEVAVPETAGLGAFSVTSYLQNHKPDVEIVTVENTATNGVFKVTWDVLDFDDNADVQFSLVTSRETKTGLHLATVQEHAIEQVTYLDTRDAAVHAGNYYIMATVFDKANAPVHTYSQRAIHVNHADDPEPVRHIAVRGIDRGCIVTWAHPEGEEPLIYEVLYTTKESLGVRNFEGSVTVPGSNLKVEIPNLENGKPLIITVVSHHAEDTGFSEAVEFVRVTPGAGFGRHAPVIVSEPHHSAVAGHNYVYFPLVYDADAEYSAADHAAHGGVTEIPSEHAGYTWELLSAPAGMTVHSSGLIQWIPTTDQVGSFTVIVKVTEPSAHEELDEEALHVTAHSAEQRFEIVVHPGTDLHDLNPRPNLFLTFPPLVARENSTFTYRPSILAPPGWQLHLREGPQGMRVTNNIVQWEVPASGTGALVRLEAITPSGGTVEQRFFLGVRTAINTASHPALLRSVTRTAAGMEIRWIGDGRAHQLQRSAQLHSGWANIGAPIFGEGFQGTVDTSPLDRQAFYRLITID